MAIPKYNELIKPVLEFYSDEVEHSVNELIEELSKKLKLTSAELNEKLPSGKQSVFSNRVGWAKTYLTKALLLEKKQRSIYKITKRGIEYFKNCPGSINKLDLMKFTEFKDFASREIIDKNDNVFNNESVLFTDKTPEETIEFTINEINNQLESDLISQIKQSSPRFFEELVIDLLLKMGYGGSRIDAGQVVGKSNDGGIDGIIKEDKLGLDSIYIQAKRYDETPIGRPKIQEFAGALQGHKANKGVFITTSSFTSEAKNFAANLSSKIILIDGNRLAKLLIEHNVGVLVERSYEIKKIDNEYFSEE